MEELLITEIDNDLQTNINNNLEVIPKKRGRKPKNKLIEENTLNLTLINSINSSISSIKVLKKRGRKPKIQLENREGDERDADGREADGRKGKKGKRGIGGIGGIGGIEGIGGIGEIDQYLNSNIEKKKKKKDATDKNQLMSTEVEIQLLKEVDFSNDGFIDKNYVENDNFLSNIWLNKYQPKTLSQVIGNKDNIIKIKKWLLNYDNSSNHAAVISGGHGIGKNLIIRLALKELGYQIKNIYSTSLKNKNIIFEIIHSCAKTKNVYNSINHQINNLKYAIVIDDTESITLTSEKENLAELLKLNAEHKYFPIIFISNLQHSKLINNLKKVSLEITLNAPTIEQTKEYIINICKKEKMDITDDKIYYQIIKFSQADIRRLLYVLQDLYYTYGNKPVTIMMFKEYQLLSQKKDIDVGLYYATKNLLDEYKNVNECLQLYETEKVLLPLTIYENYYKKIFKQKMLNNDILEIMTNITNSVSIGDVIETNIYSDQNWFLQNIHGFYTCADTSYTINNIANKYIESGAKPKKFDYELVFSADLNKTSSKNINKKKNILALQTKLKNKNINDILYINKIFFELEKNKSNSIIKTLKDTYGLTVKDIQIALKIDKTNEKINEKNDKKFNDSLNNINQDEF
jgi:hypothetical protein